MRNAFMRLPRLAALALLPLAACSTEGMVTGATGAAPLPRAAAWLVTAQGCEDASLCETIRLAVAQQVLGAGLAERMAVAGQPADRALDIQVTQVRAVSGAARVMLGAMAGRNVVAATNTVRAPDGTTLRSFKVESASAAHPLSGETSMTDAVRQFAADTTSGLR